MDQLQLRSQQQQQTKAQGGGNSVDGQSERPPRIRYFNFKRYIRELWGTKSGNRPKVDNPLPNRMDNPLPNRMDNMRTFRRITSSPSPSIGASMEKRMTAASASTPKCVKGHKRRSSDEVMGGMYVM